MKKMTFVLLSLSMALAPTLSWSDDQPSAQPSPASAANPGTPEISQAIQTPPQNWTSLKGTVQAVDPASKTVQIKDDAGQVIQVPVDKEVKIEKDGKKMGLSQLQTGDIVILAKKPTSNPDGSKTY